MRTVSKLNQHGSLHLGIVALVLALALVGFVGYKVATSNKQATDTASTSQQATSTSSGGYTSADEVSAADQSLDTAEVDQELDTTQLDSDINNLL